ncbi:hypothetical protein OG410_06735 [Streptomyces sp. NBC_00659]|uniref:hypothetical protein n=1 Tax=Streptomyces sp. NBC_00659 TaxID=2903669 RepID=UPI002E335C49|nr:hypothetical protein [Streptomyces sp. NBC_00659]
MTAGWCTRMLRAVMFAAVCVVLAALGHVMMSGSPVAWWALAGAGTGTAGAGWCLAGRERGLPFVVSVVVLAQGALHSAFSMAQSLAFAADAGTGSGAGPAQSGRGVMDGMSMDAMGSMGMSSMDVMDIGSMGMGSMGSLTMDSGTMGSGAMVHLFPWGADAGSPSSYGMFAAHLLAALLCGLWLGHGERAAFRVLRAVAGRLAAPLRLLLALPLPPYRPTLRVRRRSSDRAPRLLLLVHAITSRGPPVGTAVA